MFELKIPVKINYDDLGIEYNDIKERLQYLLAEYDYDFDKQLFEMGFIRLLKQAIRDTIEEKHEQMYKGEYVNYEFKNGHGSRAKWLITSKPFKDKIRLELGDIECI